MELFKASRQWAERPADERFATIEDMHVVCANYMHQAKTAESNYAALRAQAYGSEVELVGSTGVATKLTHWAFGQLASRAEAPAGYLRTLPAPLAAECLNTGLAKRGDDKAVLMFHSNGGLICRSITSDRYDRIWNADITKRLVSLVREHGWINPPAYADADAKGAFVLDTETHAKYRNMGMLLNVSPGATVAPSGLYASDHDMFAFLVNPAIVLRDGSDGGLRRGFFAWNSEVGSASFGLSTFMYRDICGNHIVWDASNLTTVKIRHVGDANERAFRELIATVERFSNQSASEDEARIEHAQSMRLGANKDEVLDRLFGLRLPVAKKTIDAAYESTRELDGVDGDPLTVYGMVNGLTRVAQAIPYADERVAVERAAGKVMSIAF